VDGTADGELEGAAVVAALGAVNGVALEDVGSAGRCDTDDAASSGGDAADGDLTRCRRAQRSRRGCIIFLVVAVLPEPTVQLLV
jgi:hypothetical protein